MSAQAFFVNFEEQIGFAICSIICVFEVLSKIALLWGQLFGYLGHEYFTYYHKAYNARGHDLINIMVNHLFEDGAEIYFLIRQFRNQYHIATQPVQGHIEPHETLGQIVQFQRKSPRLLTDS